MFTVDQKGSGSRVGAEVGNVQAGWEAPAVSACPLQAIAIGLEGGWLSHINTDHSLPCPDEYHGGKDVHRHKGTDSLKLEYKIRISI